MPPSASRAIVLPTTLQIASVGCPLRFISRRAASVSAVSPLCVMANSSVLVVERRVAVAQLAGVLDFDRNAGELFDQVLADQRRVPTRAAGGEHDAVDRPQLLRREVQAAEHGGRLVAIEPAAHRVANGLGLLEDFLEHVVRIAAELDVAWHRSRAASRCGRRRPASRWMTRSESAVTTASS